MMQSRTEEISAKIARMEQIVEQIFQRAEEHPEIIPDLEKNDGLLSTYDSETSGCL